MLVCEIAFENPTDNNVEGFVRNANLLFKKITEKVVAGQPSLNVPVDKSYMKDRYSIEISEAEIAGCRFHRAAWREFLNSGEETCLIIETGTIIKLPFSQIEVSLMELGAGWDVFFPFDRSDMKATNYEPYVLGYPWGAYVYFISRAGAEKMLQRSEIRQPVDDEMLTMSMNDELEVFTEETVFFEGRTWHQITEQRRRKIMKSIFGNASWSSKSRKIIENILHDLSATGREGKFNLILDSGSLLASIRHDDLMPWDDDVDLSLNENELNSFLQALHDHPTLKCDEFVWPGNNCTYYKVWYAQGDNIPGHIYTFPFVDVWLFSAGSGSVRFRDGKIFPSSAFYPLKNSYFLGVEMKMPQEPLRCLDMQYKGWRNHIQVFPYSHRLDQSHFLPLSVAIYVDENGRMIAPEF